MNRVLAISTVASACALAVAGERYELLTGVNELRYPAVPRNVLPAGGPQIPGQFFDGDRLAGTADDGPTIVFQGVGTPFLPPNNVGALSFLFKRGSIPAGPSTRIPFLGIDFLGGARLDLDGNSANDFRSIVAIFGDVDPVFEAGIESFIELSVDIEQLTIRLDHFDATGTNEGAPGVNANTATVVNVLAGSDTSANPGPAVNPTIDTRVGTLTPLGASDPANVYRIANLGFEFWQDSVDPGSSQADTLGTFQYLGSLRGWLVQRDPATLNFPTLAGAGLGSTLWPAVNTAAIGTTVNTANGLAGGTATIAGGSGADFFGAPNNGGLALTSFGGDLGAYLGAVVVPQLPANAYRFVYLESAGFGVNNSGDPVFGDTISYDAVIIAGAVCPGDVNGSGAVDDSDLGLLLNSFGSVAGDPNYSEAADLDGDGDVDDSDLGLLLNNFGQSCL